MGWSKGKGLGRQEQGEVEPVRLSYKNDTQGMGFKGHDDDWLCHRDEFSAMLSELNGADNPEKAEQETIPIKSLEIRSKTSKSRVHYHKFTRGKDLSRYSSQDLACILGKRATSTSQETEKVESEEDQETTSPEIEKSHGLVTIQGGSINEYFAAKMAALKSKPNRDDDSKEVDDRDALKMEAKGKPTKSVQFREELTEVKEFISYQEEKALRKKEKSLKKKRKDNQENGEAVLLESMAETETGQCEEITTEAAMEVVETETKKKKKKKDKKTDVDLTDAEAQVDVIESKLKKEKKKKKKKTEDEAVVEEVAAQSEDEGALKEKRKKKKEKKDKDKEENENKTTNESQPEPAKDEKISQEESAVTAETTAESRPEQVDITDLENVNSKKMKKKRKKQLQKEARQIATSDNTVQIPKPKKRKLNEDDENSSRKKSRTEPQNDKSDATEQPLGKYTESPNFSYLHNSVKPETMKKAVANYNFADFEQFKGSNLYAIAGYGH